MQKHHFYALIIGSEILNGRRVDKHFNFLRDALLERGHVLYSSFIIKDDYDLIHKTFTMIHSDPHAVMFSFGGIGSTPDDLTRQIAADVFSDGILYSHPKFHQDIIDRFGNEAYPHRIHMAELPKESSLLHNVVNNMSGFYLKERYFFMPGFPEMSHPMVIEALERFYPQAEQSYRLTLTAQTSENTLIDIMNILPSHIEFSSLPMFKNNIPSVEISILSSDLDEAKHYFELFINELNNKKITYNISEG